MKIDELIKELKYTVLHLPWSQIRKDADEVVGRVVATLEAQQGRIAELEAELKEERYRHDRVQDFEVAEAQALAKLREERRWIPVGERLPESKEKVLVYGGRTEIWINGTKQPMPSIHTGYLRGLGDGWFSWDHHDYICDVTHWMPLPESPEVDD
jgi:hypothetical protein